MSTPCDSSSALASLSFSGWCDGCIAVRLVVLVGCRGDYNAALAAIVDALPLQTRKSVIAHCRWHADLCELDMRK